MNGNLKYFQDFLNSCNINRPFSIEIKKRTNCPNYVEFIWECGKLTTIVYPNLTFSGGYSNFKKILPSIYKFAITYTLVYR